MKSAMLSEIVMRKATSSDRRIISSKINLQIAIQLIIFSLLISLFQLGNGNLILQILSNLIFLTLLVIVIFLIGSLLIFLFGKKPPKDLFSKETFVVIYRKKLIGNLEIVSFTSYSYIYRFEIDRNFRRQGIGSEMIKYLSQNVVKPPIYF